MGAIVESPSVYTNMTAEENLGMLCTMFAIPKNRIATTLQMVGLGNMIGNAKKVGNYSLGMRQRLGIAMSLITEAEFMILDEPLNGLDPEGIVEMRNLILKLNKEYGITFLISSHILTELSLVATKYGIISKGHIIKEITADELANECEKYYDIVTLDKKATLDALLTITDASNIREKENGYIVKANELELSKVMASLTGLPIQAINTVTTSIEDYYLSVIKGGRR
jgi:ABC-2 type transport system ATP-binding protein